MKFHQGFYSLIQFCPDPARLEAANVGVLLFCPDRSFLSVQVSRDNRRVHQFFGREGQDWQQINLFKRGIEQRISREASRIQNIDQLQRFIDSRANLIRFSAPIPMRITDPEADLAKLFDSLVGGDSAKNPSPRKRFQTVVTERLRAANLGGKLCESVPIEVPYLKKPISFPFGFQNGRFNLLQPVSFVTEDPDDAVRKAFPLAYEGGALYEQPHQTLGNLKLLVIGEFSSKSDESRANVRSVLESHHVRMVPLDKLDDLVQEILATGKVLDV